MSSALHPKSAQHASSAQHAQPTLQPRVDTLPTAGRALRELPNDRPITPEQALEIARYVAQITGELGLMTRAAKLDSLAYFIEMARIDAQTLLASRGRR